MNATTSPTPSGTNRISTAGLMTTTLVALTPAIAVQLWFSGASLALTLVFSCVLALLLDAAALTLRGRAAGYHLQDGSALVIAALLWLLLPVSAPWWLTATGLGIAVIVGKHLYGGLGQNLFNPVLLAYLGLAVLFADTLSGNDVGLLLDNENLRTYSISLALVAGGVYLILRRIISWHIPTAVLLATALLHYVFDTAPSSNVAMLAAFFLATDPVTSPATRPGKLVFGLLIALVSMILGNWLSYPVALAAAVLLMNASVPTLDHISKPEPKQKKPREAAQ